MAVNPAAVPLVGLRVPVTPFGRPDKDRVIVGRFTVEDPGVRETVTL